MSTHAQSQFKTVIVLGASYGGGGAAQALAAGIPDGWRIVLVDRNSHANHIYVFPRYAVLGGHEHKAFIPYSNVFLLNGKPSPHIKITAHILEFNTNSVTLSKSFPEHGIPTQTLNFEYAIYALGAHLPSPLDIWGHQKQAILASPKFGPIRTVYAGEKAQGIEWLKENQKMISEPSTVLIVGGGALGIQYATDIAAVHPTKKITLLHSRDRLLPRFDEAMHVEIIRALKDSNVEVILGDRLDLASVKDEKVDASGQRVVKTTSGREIAAELLLLCTGQSPNTDLLSKWDPSTVDSKTGLAHVLPTMQLGVLPPQSLSTPSTEDNSETAQEETTPYPHIFAIGDSADAFGAIAAGHTAYYQGGVAARNIIKLIKARESSNPAESLEAYKPSPPAIKVSLGLTKGVYQYQGGVNVSNEGQEDLQAATVWASFGIKVENDEQMRA
ncbi:FAD/NAD(P)-binding domain-containing protein [Pluteus cervinus]|uniref:FAD/NAD(P)-binding domain-containing protein n=1 Tax=Pluteus cervinus TaxID=181527 RepID=A0ACD3B2P1_9AGAR|nr:FAD/NAD(P)-binding domain-containing protein [Pluteus cervinus]